MHGSLLVAGLVVVAAIAGCLGGDVHIEPAPSSTGPESSFAPATRNERPVPVVVLVNETGKQAPRHYVGDKLTADARGSYDPDGTIANFTWRLLRQGYLDPQFGEHFGPTVNLTFTQPGDRSLILMVRDDDGAVEAEHHYFGVNQHRVETGRLVLGQAPTPMELGGDPIVGPKNFSLPVVEGALALSINATFPNDASAMLRLEIRAPNGTLLNRSEGAKAPLWAIAIPIPGVVGNYTAHVSLVTGVAIEYRIEFEVWYGYV